jgi:hypothetical protein
VTIQGTGQPEVMAYTDEQGNLCLRVGFYEGPGHHYAEVVLTPEDLEALKHDRMWAEAEEVMV